MIDRLELEVATGRSTAPCVVAATMVLALQQLAKLVNSSLLGRRVLQCREVVALVQNLCSYRVGKLSYPLKLHTIVQWMFPYISKLVQHVSSDWTKTLLAVPATPATQAAPSKPDSEAVMARVD